MNVARTVAAIAASIGLGILLAPPTVTAQPTMDPTVVVVDASARMMDTDAEGRTRIDTVKTAVQEFLDAAPAHANLNMVAVGTGTGPGEEERETGCQDVSVLGHHGEQSVADMKRAVNTLAPRGYAPLGAAMTRAHELLPDSGKRAVVLVAGGVDTCAPPPACEVAQHINAEYGGDLVVHTIGFMVDDAARDELTCIAQATEGTYADANTEDALRTTLGKMTTRVDQGSYQYPAEIVHFGKNREEAPEVKLGTLERPHRITARTLRESEEEDNHNVLRLRIPRGHRIHIGFTAVPKGGNGAGGGVVFSPTLQYEQDNLLVDCPSNSGSGRGNFMDTTAPIAGFLVGEHYDEDSPCYDADVYLDIGMMRSNEFHDFVDLDMTLAAVPEPENLGDAFNSVASQARQEQDFSVLSSEENVVAVPPATQPDGAHDLVGTTYGEIAEGQTHFYAVPISWGQALDGTFEVLRSQEESSEEEAGAEVGAELDAGVEPGSEPGSGADAAFSARAIEIQALNPLGQPQEIIGHREIDLAKIAEPATFGTMYPVSYANVDANDTSAQSFWMGGKQYVALSYINIAGNIADDAPAAPTVKYRLTLKPHGKEVVGPKFNTVATTEALINGKQQGSRQPTNASPVARTTGASPALKIVGGGVAASAVLITAVIVLIKTRRS